jgi:ferredoxin--NADP+ reductase
MLWQLLRQGHRGRILAACCVRYRRDLAYLELHGTLEKRYPNYTYLTLVTREPEVEGRKVYIQDLITSGQLEEQLGQCLNPASTHVFLCGNPKMIGLPEKEHSTGQWSFPQPPGVIEILQRRGFCLDHSHLKQVGNIHYEKYW